MTDFFFFFSSEMMEGFVTRRLAIRRWLCGYVESFVKPFSYMPSLFLSNCSKKVENAKESPFAFLTQDWDMGNVLFKCHERRSLS